MCISFSGCVFFFFKQKTAYEMRISDWSSDVCSSDLAECRAFAGFAFEADFATHQLGELARDRQTEAAAADLAAANLPERLEQPLALLGGDADPGIGNRETQPVPASIHALTPEEPQARERDAEGQGVSVTGEPGGNRDMEKN